MATKREPASTAMIHPRTPELMCGSPRLVEGGGFLTTGISAIRPIEAVAVLVESKCDGPHRQNVSGSEGIDLLEQRHSP